MCRSWPPGGGSLLMLELIFKSLYKLIKSNVKAHRFSCLLGNFCSEVRNYLLLSSINFTYGQLMPCVLWGCSLPALAGTKTPRGGRATSSSLLYFFSALWIKLF